MILTKMTMKYFMNNHDYLTKNLGLNHEDAMKLNRGGFSRLQNQNLKVIKEKFADGKVIEAHITDSSKPHLATVNKDQSLDEVFYPNVSSDEHENSIHIFGDGESVRSSLNSLPFTMKESESVFSKLIANGNINLEDMVHVHAIIYGN